MKRSFIECDECDFQQQTEPAMYGPGHSWIEVSKGQSQSGDLLSSGEHMFCSEGCLNKFMARLKPKKRN